MFESIISACEVLEAFGLPRAAGNLRTDRFIVANESFLRIVGLQKDDISSAALSEVVKIDLDSADAVKIGRLVPITVRTVDEGVTIGGHATITRDRLAFLMIPLFIDPSPDFEIGAAVGKELQRQKVAAYIHDHLAPEMLAAVFSLESVRARLEKENQIAVSLRFDFAHLCEEQLKDIQQRLTGSIRKMGETLEGEETNPPVG